jgi:YHS domain-containing protein
MRCLPCVTKVAAVVAVVLVSSWGAWYAAAANVAGVCAPGRTVSFVPNGHLDENQANVCTGCSGGLAQDTPGVPQPNPTLGAVTNCPVSGVPFELQEHHPVVQYAGESYRFCCSGCAKVFEADPKRFLAPVCL